MEHPSRLKYRGVRAGWAALAAAALVSGCDEPRSPTAPSATEVTISGRVVEYVAQAPVAGVVVRFELETPDGPRGRSRPRRRRTVRTR